MTFGLRSKCPGQDDGGRRVTMVTDSDNGVISLAAEARIEVDTTTDDPPVAVEAARDVMRNAMIKKVLIANRFIIIPVHPALS